MKGMELFHKKYENIVLMINVTRYPYSFIGDSKKDEYDGGGLNGYNSGSCNNDNKNNGGSSCKMKKKKLPTWHEALLGYTGSAERRASAEAGMKELGKKANINFNFHVPAQWQPIESQRLLLWCGRYGRQEEYMTLINKKHFEEQKSASYRDTLLEAIEEVGLNVEDANAFLNTNELEDYVWEWYGRTIYEKNIHSIPLFVFNVPIIDAVGLPFRSSGKRKPYLVKGSGSSDYFAALFEQIYMDVQRFSM